MHKTDIYLLDPQHKITIELVGMGGTGSQVLNNLGRLNMALIGLGHPGLHVRAWDNDTISPANLGRQLFSPADIGLHKSTVLVSRVNRFFGTEWEAMTTKYNCQKLGNIIITCVDTAAARVSIAEKLKSVKPKGEMYDYPFYWLDLGNLQHTGQCVLGTIHLIRGKNSLKNVVQLFPQIKKIKEEKQGPSCSLAEALEKQDLFINSTLAQFGCNLLWKLIREGEIRYHGCYVNLKTLSVNPIKI